LLDFKFAFQWLQIWVSLEPLETYIIVNFIFVGLIEMHTGWRKQEVQVLSQQWLKAVAPIWHPSTSYAF